MNSHYKTADSRSLRAYFQSLNVSVAQGIRSVVLAAASVSVAVTAAVALIPQLHSAHKIAAYVTDHSPALHVAIETAVSLIALLAGFLIVVRLQRRTHLDEFVLGCSLAVLALSNLIFVTVPMLTWHRPGNQTVWSALLSLLLGALLFAVAAFVPRRRLRRSGLLLAVGAAGVTVALSVVVACVKAFGPSLPQLVVPALPPGRPSLPDLPVDGRLLALEVLMAGLYSIAAVGFLARSQRHDDELFGWLAVGAVMAAASLVNYFLYPSQASQWVYSGDAFRLAFYVVLLVGSMREIWSYWRELSDAAVLEERRRIARDLHDGLAQELAFLARNLGGLDGTADADTLRRLRSAVDRARLESRQAIATLATPRTRAFEDALAEAAADIAERYRIELDLDLIPEVRLSPTRAEALVRIACEAITNSARHSGAQRVCVSLQGNSSRVRLRVSDSGSGFNTTVSNGGYGLVSMRERARSVGGELRISSTPGSGSVVEVAV